MQHQSVVYTVAFSPDGQTVLTGSSDNTVRLWDVRSGQSISPPLQLQDFIGGWKGSGSKKLNVDWSMRMLTRRPPRMSAATTRR